MIIEERQKNQNDNMFKKPDAISLAPNCKGIKRFEKVPDKPPVKRKNTIIVPCIVTKPRYISSFNTPPGAHVSPKKNERKSEPSPGHANCILNRIDKSIATIPIKVAVIKNCFPIIL